MRSTGARAIGCALAVFGLAAAAQPADDGVLRQQLAAQRQEIDARFQREQAECRQRFAVNACLDQARAHQRKSLSDHRAREHALDERQREKRASGRQQAIERRQQAVLERSAAPEPRASAAQAEPATPRPLRGRDRASAAAEAQAKAAERAAAARKLQAAIQADQERIKARQAHRAAQGRKAEPLPPPPAPSAPR